MSVLIRCFRAWPGRIENAIATAFDLIWSIVDNRSFLRNDSFPAADTDLAFRMAGGKGDKPMMFPISPHSAWVCRKRRELAGAMTDVMRAARRRLGDDRS